MMEHTITLPDDRKLGYKIYGPSSKEDAKSIILYFVGTPSTRNYLTERQINQLSLMGGNNNICFISIERPGFGLSDSKQNRTLLSYAEDVTCFCSTIIPQGKKVSIIGYSGGGPFALACANKIPDVIQKVVLVCSLGPRSHPDSTKGMHWFNRLGYFIASTSSWLVEKAVASDVSTFLNDPKKKILKDYEHNKTDHNYLSTNEDVLEMFIASTKECYEKGQYVTEAWEYHLFATDWGFKLEDIKIPITVFYGEDDTACTPSMSLNISDSVQSSTAHCIKGQAHMVMFDKFEDIVQAAL